MALTEFGKIVRKARIDVGTSLLEMSKSLNVSSSFLSGMEMGRKKITLSWVNKINGFFLSKGHEIQNLAQAALISNQYVPIGSLPLQHQMLALKAAREEVETLTLDMPEHGKDLMAAHPYTTFKITTNSFWVVLGAPAGSVVGHPNHNKIGTGDMIKQVFGVDVNALKWEAMSADTQKDAKKNLIKLLRDTAFDL